MSITKSQYYDLYKTNHKIFFDTIIQGDPYCNHPMRLMTISATGSANVSFDGTVAGAFGDLDDYFCEVNIDMSLLTAWTRAFRNNFTVGEPLSDFEFRPGVSRRAPWQMLQWETGGTYEVECGDYTVNLSGGTPTTGSIYAYFKPTILSSGGNIDSGGRTSETGEEHEIAIGIPGYSFDTTGISGRDSAVSSTLSVLSDALGPSVLRNPWSDAWANTSIESSDRFDLVIQENDGVNNIVWTGSSNAYYIFGY